MNLYVTLRWQLPVVCVMEGGHHPAPGPRNPPRPPFPLRSLSGASCQGADGFEIVQHLCRMDGVEDLGAVLKYSPQSHSQCYHDACASSSCSWDLTFRNLCLATVFQYRFGTGGVLVEERGEVIYLSTYVKNYLRVCARVRVRV